MKLSKQSIQELKIILQKQFGNYADNFSDEEIEELGLYVLNIFSEALKKKAKKILN